MKAVLAVALLALGTADLVWINFSLLPLAVSQTNAPDEEPVLAQAKRSPTAIDVAPAGIAVAAVPGPAAAAVPAPREVAMPRRVVDSAPPQDPELLRVPSDFGSVSFSTAATKISAEGAELLTSLADVVDRDPAVTVELRGHADRRGRPAMNRRLARQRANAARAFLLKLGVDSDRIRVAGAGAREPVIRGADSGSHAANRRVDIFLRPTQEEPS